MSEPTQRQTDHGSDQQQPLHEGGRSKVFHLPTETARAITIFKPVYPSSAEECRDELLNVELLDYGLFTILQITLVTKMPLLIRDVVVNHEFRPTLSIGDSAELFFELLLPRPITCGMSFTGVIHAPAAPDSVQPHCYRNRPAFIMISTDRGDFGFEEGESV